MRDQFAGGMPALHQIQLLFPKEWLEVSTTIIEAEKIIEQAPAAIPEYSITLSAFTVRSDAFQVE